MIQQTCREEDRAQGRGFNCIGIGSNSTLNSIRHASRGSRRLAVVIDGQSASLSRQVVKKLARKDWASLYESVALVITEHVLLLLRY